MYYNNKGCFYEVKADVVEKKQRLGTNENFHFSYSNNTGTLHWKKKKNLLFYECMSLSTEYTE